MNINNNSLKIWTEKLPFVILCSFNSYCNNCEKSWVQFQLNLSLINVDFYTVTWLISRTQQIFHYLKRKTHISKSSVHLITLRSYFFFSFCHLNPLASGFLIRGITWGRLWYCLTVGELAGSVVIVASRNLLKCEMFRNLITHYASEWRSHQ